MDYCGKLYQCVMGKDGIVGVIDVHQTEGYCFSSLCGPFAECDVELYLDEGFDPLASEANEWVL